MPELTVTSEIYGEYDYRTKTTPSTDGSKYEIIWNYLFTYLFYEFLISIRANLHRDGSGQQCSDEQFQWQNLQSILNFIFIT